MVGRQHVFDIGGVAYQVNARVTAIVAGVKVHLKGIGRYIDFYKTRRPHSSLAAGRGALRIAAGPPGQGSLTPQGPLKNLRNLFRSTGPTLLHLCDRFLLPASAVTP